MTSRFTAVDALRGFIMILMAIDHSNAYIARQHSSEFWSGAMTMYDSAFPFLTRWITHLCAPGFFFLMGAGIYWFAESRRKLGWSESQLLRRVAGRGLALFLVGMFLETPVLFSQSFLKPPLVSLSKTLGTPPLDGTRLWWGFITMAGLGMVMMACSLLLRWGVRVWAGVGALAVIATNTMLPADGKVGPIWETILLAPGISQHLLVMYPLVPWLGVAAFGMCFGWWWKRNGASAPKVVPFVGMAIVLVAVALRAAGGFGNIRLPRDGGWIEFLNTVKYPPSLVLWMTSIGIDLMILGLLVKLPEWVKSERSPLMVFGQTAAFFYIAHLYLYSIIGFRLFRETAGSLQMAYVVWAIGLVILYPVCVRYRKFKNSKPVESLWRMF